MGQQNNDTEYLYYKELWSGDSRDGNLVNGEGYHYYRMTKKGFIEEAYEFYEHEDGREIVSILPEMKNVSWIDDLGFDDMEILDLISKQAFDGIKELYKKR